MLLVYQQVENNASRAEGDMQAHANLEAAFRADLIQIR
jgi:hypothetical protein